MRLTTTHTGPSATARLVFGLLGTFFVGVTLCVLLADVTGIGSLTTGHLMTVAALVGAITSGLFFGPTLRKGHLLTALGLAIAFTGATTYCVVSSAGRADDAAYEANATARQINDERARYQRDLGEAKSRYNAALAAETAECSGGKGSKCIAKRELTVQARSDVEVATILVSRAKPEQREDGKLQRAAEVWSLATGHSVEASLHGFKMIWPFVPPCVAELLSIIFIHKAFAGAKSPGGNGGGTRKPSPETSPAVETVAETVAETVVVPFKRPNSRADVIAYVKGCMARGETIASQDAIAKRFNVRKGTVSRWLAALERDGILDRTRVGRRNSIAKRATA